ncbi:Hypothetical predicted protein [Mytilus galloprovincialis]|uniref:Uncharacterized protein n=1 Tax=Mytilus galloprovincialis TaxID=29158 RepID=A0A8B6C9Q0_MYTGA|nr:Hypothetical predicted protein [Mytilus galloprovincialis]
MQIVATAITADVYETVLLTKKATQRYIHKFIKLTGAANINDQHQQLQKQTLELQAQHRRYEHRYKTTSTTTTAASTITTASSTITTASHTGVTASTSTSTTVATANTVNNTEAVRPVIMPGGITLDKFNEKKK